VGTWLRRHWGWRAGWWVTAMGENDAGATPKRPAGYSAAEAHLPEDAQAGVGQGDTMGDAEAGVGVGGEELGCAKTRWRQTWKPLRATGQRKLTSESEKVERLQVRKSLSRAMRIFGAHNQSNQKPLRRKALRTTDSTGRLSEGTHLITACRCTRITTSSFLCVRSHQGPTLASKKRRIMVVLQGATMNWS